MATARSTATARTARSTVKWSPRKPIRAAPHGRPRRWVDALFHRERRGVVEQETNLPTKNTPSATEPAPAGAPSSSIHARDAGVSRSRQGKELSEHSQRPERGAGDCRRFARYSPPRARGGRRCGASATFGRDCCHFTNALRACGVRMARAEWVRGYEFSLPFSHDRRERSREISDVEILAKCGG
jgi:hypothetical protein